MRPLLFPLLAALSLLSSLHAQELAPPTTTVSSTTATTTTTSNGQPVKIEVKVNGQEIKQPQAVRERERTVYVPYDELEKVFKDGGKGVFLPYKEFLELWNELTLKRKEEEVKPPQEGVISKAEYTGHVEGETLVIDAKISVESFKKGWLTLSLAKDGAVPGIAEAETGKAILNAKPDGYDLILPDKGVYELKLKIYAPIKKSAGTQTVSLVLPRAAVSRFTATVPGAGFEFEVNPTAAFTSRPAGTDTELSFFFGSGVKFDVSWSKPETATALTPLVLASSVLTTEVHGGSLATSAKIDLRVLRAPVASFAFLLPVGQTVQGVTGSDVKDWKLDTSGNQQKLTITPNAPVKDLWNVTLALEAPLPKLPAEVPLPEITLEGATQDRGEISIAAESQLDVIPKPTEGLVQQTQSSAPSQGLSAIGGYRFLKHPAKLSLAVAEAKPQVDVESLTLLHVKRDTSRVEATFNYNIRRVGVFEARVALPGGWTGLEIVGLPADQWAIEAEMLVVKFNKQTLGQTSFTVRGQQQRANPTENTTVPVFAPQGVVRYEAKIGVGVHSSLEVTTKDVGDLRLDDVSSLNIQQPQQQQQARALDAELTLAFRHRDVSKTPAVLTFKARDPQVNVEVLTLLEAKEQSLRHTWTLAFEVAYAATDRFVLAVPSKVAGDIRFVDPNVKEIHKEFKADDKLKAALPGAEDYVLWEVIMRNERIGAFQLSLSVEKPLATGKDEKIDLQQVHVPGVFQEIGQVAVLKDDSLEIRDYKAESLEEIDPKELRDSLQRGGVFLAFKYKAQPLKLSLNVVKNAYIAVPQAIVTHAVLTTAVSIDRWQTTETIYWVKNNSQQFLTVKLPKGSRLVSDIFVNGSTQQPMHREGSDDLLVRLPSGSAATQNAGPVRFVYEMPSPKAGEKLGWWGSIDVEPPTLADVNVVLESQHVLYLPEGNLYTKFDGAMTQSTLDRGWARVRNIADQLIPAFGPQMDHPHVNWNAPPQIQPQQRAAFGFQITKQGQPFTLHRLGAPSEISASFRAVKVNYVYEAIAFILIILWGLRQWSHPLSQKVAWVIGVSLAAVVSTGILSAANGRISKSVVLALGLVIGLWLVLGVLSFFKAIGPRAPKPKPVDVPPVPSPVTASPLKPATAAKVNEPLIAAEDPLEFPKLDANDTPITGDVPEEK